jgi:hypothetical protein
MILLIKKSLSVLMLLFAFLMLKSCQFYSFKGISISPDVKTYTVPTFKNLVGNAPPTISLTFTEKLKDQIRNNTRLRRVDTEGGAEADLTFVGNIVEFSVNALSAQPGQPAAINQLKISVEIDFTNIKEEKNNWKQVFSFQQEFPSGADLISVQDQLIQTISKKIVEDIFNKAFTENW